MPVKFKGGMPWPAAMPGRVRAPVRPLLPLAVHSSADADKGTCGALRAPGLDVRFDQ